MIKTKDDLKRYLEADRIRLEINRKRPRLYGDDVWKFQRLYRITEYHYNNRKKNYFHKIIAFAYLAYFRHVSKRLGCEFPMNVIQEGLVIWHGQNILINGRAKIGKNFSISSNCIVGRAKGKFPVIEDNVSLSAGSMILGGVKIAKGVKIGAGTVIVKDITDEGSVWVGAAARQVH